MGSKSGVRQTWVEICSCGDYRGRWVALDGVRYEESTTRPAEGTVIDSDDDLAQLCARLRSENRRCCAIVHADEDQPPPMSAFRPARRAMAH